MFFQDIKNTIAKEKTRFDDVLRRTQFERAVADREYDLLLRELQSRRKMKIDEYDQLHAGLETRYKAEQTQQEQVMRAEVLKQREDDFKSWQEYEHKWHCDREKLATELAQLTERVENKKALLKEMDANIEKRKEDWIKADESMVEGKDAVIKTLQELLTKMTALVPKADLSKLNLTAELKNVYQAKR